MKSKKQIAKFENGNHSGNRTSNGYSRKGGNGNLGESKGKKKEQKENGLIQTELRQKGNRRKNRRTKRRNNKGNTTDPKTFPKCLSTKLNNLNRKLKGKGKPPYRKNGRLGINYRKNTKTRRRQNSRNFIKFCNDTKYSFEDASSFLDVDLTRYILETSKSTISHATAILKDQNTFASNTGFTSNEEPFLIQEKDVLEKSSVGYFENTYVQNTYHFPSHIKVPYTYENVLNISSNEELFSPTPSYTEEFKNMQISTDKLRYHYHTSYENSDTERQQRQFLKQQQHFEQKEKQQNIEQHEQLHYFEQQHQHQQQQQQSSTIPLSIIHITNFKIDSQQSTNPAEKALSTSIISTYPVFIESSIISSSYYQIATNTQTVAKEHTRYMISASNDFLSPSYPSLFRTPMVSTTNSNLNFYTHGNLPNTFQGSESYSFETKRKNPFQTLDHFISIRPSFSSQIEDKYWEKKSSYNDAKGFSISEMNSVIHSRSREYLDNSSFIDTTAANSSAFSSERNGGFDTNLSKRISSNKSKRVLKRKRLRFGIEKTFYNITMLRDWRKRVRIQIPRRKKQKERIRTRNKNYNTETNEIQQTTTIQPNNTQNDLNIDIGYDSNIGKEIDSNDLPEESPLIDNHLPREEYPMDTGTNTFSNDSGINRHVTQNNGSLSQEKLNPEGTVANENTDIEQVDGAHISDHGDETIDDNETDLGTEEKSSGNLDDDFHNDMMNPTSKLCASMDFVGAQGKRCCQKSIRCFGDLPTLIDEIETYNSSEDQDELQRQHVCQHIKNSMLCLGHAMALPVCKSSVTFVHRKLNDTLSDVTQFHTESCQTGSSSAPIIPTTRITTARPGGTGSQGGIKSHTHEHTNMAAIIGGVAGGAILIFLIILIVLLLRKNKSKRPSEFRVKDADGGISLANGSSRYKNHIGLNRKHSEVYAEIDESSMHSNQSFSDKRPLPSAPSNGPIASDNTGYLTPRGSKEALGLTNDRDSGGYHVLQKEASRKPSVDAYAKLQNEEGEYIEPTNISDTRVRIPSQKPPKNNKTDVPKPNGDDNYHMYFVLEKESGVHV